MISKKKMSLNKTSTKVSNSATFGQILKYATPWDYVLIGIGLLGSLISGINWPMLTITFGKVVDVFVDFEAHNRNKTYPEGGKEQLVSDFMQQVYVWSGMTFVIFILFTLGNFMTLYAFQLFAMRMVKRVKETYFRSILKQDISWFDKQNSGEFASRIASDFKKFENGINENFGLLVYNLAAALFNLVVGFFYGWKLSLVILSLSPIMILGSFLMTKFQTYYMQKELSAYSVASSAAEEAISAIRTVFAFGGQHKEQKRYESTLEPAMRYGCKRNFVTGLGNGVTWGSLYLAFALGIWYGVKLIINPKDLYTIGDVVIVFWGITGCGYNIGYAAPYFESLQIGRTAAKSLIEVMERKSAIDSSSTVGLKLKPDHKTDIEFRDVHFSYPTRSDIPILKGLNLKINCGEIVALVGPSGCGKSTTIQLIQRFYDPDSGEIYLDGVKLKHLNIGWLRGQLGVVGQEPVLFDASIEDNIRMGMPDHLISEVTREDIERAATEANAHEFIQKLPDNYNTYVGDRGTQLSGGQKQRIAIARALISKPKILLLDEATSALDLESEHVVQTALDRASKGRTTIIIAHRLSTIINADRIIFIEGGRVKEMGTHEELMKVKGRYYNLVMAQQVDASDDHHHNEPPKLNLPAPRRGASTINSDTSSLMMLSTNKYNDEIDSEELKNLKNTKFPHLRILKLIWLDKWYFMIAFFSALVYGLSTPFYAMIFGDFVDIFAKSDSDSEKMERTIFFSFLFLALSIGILFFCTLQITLFGIVGEKLTKRLRMMAYSAILNQEIAWFDEPANSAGALCARLANDAANVQGATGLRVSMMCQAISTLVFSIVMGFSYNWLLSSVSLALMPIVAAASLFSASIYSAQAGTDSEAVQKSSKLLIEVMNAVRTVVSLHKEQYFFSKFADTLSKHFQSLRMKCLYKSTMIAFSLGAPFFSYTVTFLFGGYLISLEKLTSGDFFKIVEAMVFGAVVVGQSAVLSSDYTKAKLAAINIFKLIDRKPIKLYSESDAILERSTEERSKGNISFRGIHFSYPSRPNSTILNGLSFSAHQGETVALVGSSGCGKSTTIQLLERFYDCAKGKVYLDGENMARLNIDWVRRQMALVSQEPILFSYSIRDNIAYGDNSRAVSIEEIVRAAQMANVHDFIQKLPQGYDTPVGSKGTQLSGGQKQRIAIARALVRDPPVLLLDEATSALDTASEKVVQEALDEASKGRTCIVIAHRLKTILHSNKIIVIHKGQNVEEGTHDELLARKGHYWKLYNSALSSA